VSAGRIFGQRSATFKGDPTLITPTSIEEGQRKDCLIKCLHERRLKPGTGRLT